MYGSRLVERGSIDDIFYRPQMPYTIGLLASVPRIDQRTVDWTPFPGSRRRCFALPDGCTFRPRCPYSEFVPDDRCANELPELMEAEPDHDVRCHLTVRAAASVCRRATRGLGG